MTSALILSGGRDYTDPWHPFAETSRRLAGVLETAGCTTLIEDSVAIGASIDDILAAFTSEISSATANVAVSPSSRPLHRFASWA